MHCHRENVPGKLDNGDRCTHIYREKTQWSLVYAVIGTQVFGNVRQELIIGEEFRATLCLGVYSCDLKVVLKSIRTSDHAEVALKTAENLVQASQPMPYSIIYHY